MSTKPEIERKFLIKKPDEALLRAQSGACFDDILQTYLVAPPGVTARVRCREGAAGIRYFYTAKRRVTAITAMEEERTLTQDEYLDLLKGADPALTPIVKRRYTIPHGGLALEIDLYPFWSTQAVLEVEMPTEDTPLSFPPYITVLREVTEDRRYKNVSLAKEIPEE